MHNLNKSKYIEVKIYYCQNVRTASEAHRVVTTETMSTMLLVLTGRIILTRAAQHFLAKNIMNMQFFKKFPSRLWNISLSF